MPIGSIFSRFVARGFRRDAGSVAPLAPLSPAGTKLRHIAPLRLGNLTPCPSKHESAPSTPFRRDAGVHGDEGGCRRTKGARPAFPPELLREVFKALGAMGCKRTILECAVASRLTMDLAFPVLFSRLLSKNVASRSFLENGPKHAHLVRDLELSYTDFAKEGGRLGLVSSLAIFKELRSLVLRLAEPDSPPLGLVSKMKLTRLELCSSAELIPLDVIPPSVKYLAIEGCAPPDPSRTLEALDAAAGNLKTLELRVTGDHIRAFLESIPSYPRVVSAIKKLRLKGSDLQHADVLFQNPLFRPAALSIFSSTERRGRPVRLPPTLGALRGLEELELVYGKTDFLLRVSLLPQATVLVIDNYRSALAKEQSEALESALRRDYGSVYVRHIEQVRGTTCRHDAAEREMWRRLTAGKKLTVFESRSSGYIILTRDL